MIEPHILSRCLESVRLLEGRGSGTGLREGAWRRFAFCDGRGQTMPRHRPVDATHLQHDEAIDIVQPEKVS
jgi:hypothetical protein